MTIIYATKNRIVCRQPCNESEFWDTPPNKRKRLKFVNLIAYALLLLRAVVNANRL